MATARYEFVHIVAVISFQLICLRNLQNAPCRDTLRRLGAYWMRNWKLVQRTTIFYQIFKEQFSLRTQEVAFTCILFAKICLKLKIQKAFAKWMKIRLLTRSDEAQRAHALYRLVSCSLSGAKSSIMRMLRECSLPTPAIFLRRQTEPLFFRAPFAANGRARLRIYACTLRYRKITRILAP